MTSTTSVSKPFRLTASAEQIAAWAGCATSAVEACRRESRYQTFPVISMCSESCCASNPLSEVHLSCCSSVEHDSSYIPAEALSARPQFWEAFRSRRCLVPVTGFLQERIGLNRAKSIFQLSSATNPILGLAGIWNACLDRAGTPISTFQVITVVPTILLSNLFQSIPVIITSQDRQQWLTNRPGENLPIDLLRPVTAAEMKQWVMTPLLNKSKIDSQVPRDVDHQHTTTSAK